MNSISDRNPVVLVHGLNDTARVFDRLSGHLSRQGWSVYSLDLSPSNGDRPLEDLGQQLATFVHRIFTARQCFDLVGFSMGGIVSRYYLQRLGGLDRVQRFVSISSPHWGTQVAYLSQRPGCVQMRPTSPLLMELNRELHHLDRINVTTLWTPMDLMIVPARSSCLGIGQDYQVPVGLHPWMLYDRRSLERITAALTEPLRRSPAQASTASPISE